VDKILIYFSANPKMGVVSRTMPSYQTINNYRSQQLRIEAPNASQKCLRISAWVCG